MHQHCSTVFVDGLGVAFAYHIQCWLPRTEKKHSHCLDFHENSKIYYADLELWRCHAENSIPKIGLIISIFVLSWNMEMISLFLFTKWHDRRRNPTQPFKPHVKPGYFRYTFLCMKPPELHKLRHLVFAMKYDVSLWHFTLGGIPKSGTFCYRPQSRADNAFGSVRVFVCVCVCVRRKTALWLSKMEQIPEYWGRFPELAQIKTSQIKGSGFWYPTQCKWIVRTLLCRCWFFQSSCS